MGAVTGTEGDELAARRQRKSERTSRPSPITFEGEGGERLYSRPEVETILYQADIPADSVQWIIESLDFNPPVA